MQVKPRKLPTLFNLPRSLSVKGLIEESLAPGEFEVTLNFGDAEFYILALVSKVNLDAGTLEVNLVGETENEFWVSFPGEVENGMSTALVPKKFLK